MDGNRRFLTPEERRKLLRFILKRMEIDDSDELARRRWARAVRATWPEETYSGRLEVKIARIYGHRHR